VWKDNIDRLERYKQLKKIQNNGVNNPFYGKSHSEETLKKLSKEVIMYDINMEIIGEYKSATECSKTTGIPIPIISKVANNKIDSYKNLKFKYK
jgi:hypothetical protein